MNRVGFVVVGSWVALAVACGGKQSDPVPDSGSVGPGGTSTGTPTSPTSPPVVTPPSGAGGPPPPPASATKSTSSDTLVFAVDSIQLGESDRSGVASTTAWQAYGYDLDGLVSTKDSKDVCSLHHGASIITHQDGQTGRDNGFGHTIIPFLQPFVPTPSRSETDTVKGGAYDTLFMVTGLTADAAQTNVGLDLAVVRAGAFGSTPTFTANDDWPVAGSPVDTFTGAYVVNGTFVAASPSGTFHLRFGLGGTPMDLTVHDAIITFDHTSADALTNGVVAGTILAQDLVTEMDRVAGTISPQLCGGSTLDSINQTILQAADILVDGTNAAGKPCDAISIGIGFTAARVATPTKTAADPGPGPDPCK